LQPGAQQPSPFVQVVIGGNEHCTLHIAAAPLRTFVVQAFMSSHVAGQLPSHVSGGSTTLLPQPTEQSLSFVELQPGAQQLSPFVHIVIGGCVHCRLHIATEPVSTSLVHEFPSSGQVVGQFPSQSSPISTTLLPHIGAQFASLTMLQPIGQQ
jgi:hypothetical protein